MISEISTLLKVTAVIIANLSKQKQAAHREKGFFLDYNMIIVVPKGARGAFAEPFSHYTDSLKFDWETDILWDGKSKETIRGEFEWIGQ